MKHKFKELTFLDIRIENENSQIITYIYHKLTDTEKYDHFKSHPQKNCRKSIPYTLTRKICTIVWQNNIPQYK